MFLFGFHLKNKNKNLGFPTWETCFPCVVFCGPCPGLGLGVRLDAHQMTGCQTPRRPANVYHNEPLLGSTASIQV